MKPIVIVAEPLAKDPMHWLFEQCHVVEAAPGSTKFIEFAGLAQGIAIRTATRIDQDMLRLLPCLKVVARAGVGLDHIDLAACKARGVRVVHTPDANTEAVVEYVLALALDATRPRTFLTSPVGPMRWEELRNEFTAATQLGEMTVGILGLGRIGSRLASVFRSLGSTVIYHDLLEIAAPARNGAIPVSLQELFAQCDLISIHIDGRDSNVKFVDETLIGLMKNGVTFINASRGRVIDPAALADFLRKHPDAQALLDVHEPEPIASTSPLLALPNARLSPHLASRTQTAVKNMSWVVRDLVAVLNGDMPRFEA